MKRRICAVLHLFLLVVSRSMDLDLKYDAIVDEQLGDTTICETFTDKCVAYFHSRICDLYPEIAQNNLPFSYVMEDQYIIFCYDIPPMVSLTLDAHVYSHGEKTVAYDHPISSCIIIICDTTADCVYLLP